MGIISMTVMLPLGRTPVNLYIAMEHRAANPERSIGKIRSLIFIGDSGSEHCYGPNENGLFRCAV